MPLELDHIFVCCSPGAPEADALLCLGMVEGPRNVHAGQGTENRRFFFENAYLELLWVAHPSDAQSQETRRTRLWERWSERAIGACPFGIGFRPNGHNVEEPPFPTWRYAPAYLPNGLAIQFAQGTSLKEPELFYLAWPSRPGSNVSQPTDHAVPRGRLTSVMVGVPDVLALSDTAQRAASAGLIAFKQAPNYVLELGFEGEVEIVCDLSPTLPIVLKSAAGGTSNSVS